MAYGWKITAEYDSGEFKPCRPIYGPCGIKDGPRQRLDSDQGIRFRMHDDDGHLMASGKLIPDDHTDQFEPLDDYGEANYGCTEIRYWQDGGWSAL
jgi:hypothetical protein|tara:strand:+ start:316 stop:603 length:288 start_codon:yes stop_codon:yes gene_type:complete